MDALNPLDWPAEPFLLLFGTLAGGVLLLLRVWRVRLGGPAPADAAPPLGVLHLAYLSGGPDRAAAAALVGLIEAGAAVPDRARGVLRFDPSVPVPAELQPFRHAGGRAAGPGAFRSEFAPRWERLRRELARHGLVPTEAEAVRFRWQGAALLGAVLLLGGSKVLVGLSRDRPVGILLLLMLLTGVVGAVLLLRPHRNPAGTAALAAARLRHARAARAPLPEEMALAFALSGPAVLAGCDYRWALTGNGASSSGDTGGSSGDGGDGGSGCGGCSG